MLHLKIMVSNIVFQVKVKFSHSSFSSHFLFKKVIMNSCVNSFSFVFIVCNLIQIKCLFLIKNFGYKRQLFAPFVGYDNSRRKAPVELLANCQKLRVCSMSRPP